MTVFHWTYWENGEEYGKYETWVLSKMGRLNFFIEQFAKIWPVLRETEGSLRTIFPDSLLWPFSKFFQLQYQIRPVLVKWLMEIYFLADQVVGKNPILLWGITFTIYFLLFLVIKGDVCKRKTNCCWFSNCKLNHKLRCWKTWLHCNVSLV